jgi:hypothetical protein
LEETLKRAALALLPAVAFAFAAWSCGGGEGKPDGGTDAGGADAGTADGGVDAGFFKKEAVLTRGPWLQEPKSDAITVMWETDREAEPVLALSGAASGSYTGTRVMNKYIFEIGGSEVKRWQNTVKVIGLKPASNYAYSLPDLKSAGGGSFVTAPDAAAPFRFLAYGDTRAGSIGTTDHPVHKALTDAMAKLFPDFYLNTGDMVYSGAMDGEWRLFFGTSTSLMPIAPLYPVWGNHESGGDASWARFFVLPGEGSAKRYYSFDFSNAHFVVLCSDCGMGASDAQTAWLKADLEAAKKNASLVNFFAAFHDPIYTCSSHSGDGTALANVLPLLKTAGVKAVLTGHNHLYEHFLVDGIHHITIGGGGAPLYDEKSSCAATPLKWAKDNNYAVFDVSGAAVTVKVINDEGSELDSFTM